jgi:hypothetical protein
LQFEHSTTLGAVALSWDRLLSLDDLEVFRLGTAMLFSFFI